MDITPYLWIVLFIAILAGVGLAVSMGATAPIPSEVPYRGLIGSDSWNRLVPRAYVEYPPSEHFPHPMRSIEMPLGNAREYAEIFGGKVIPL